MPLTEYISTLADQNGGTAKWDINTKTAEVVVNGKTMHYKLDRGKVWEYNSDTGIGKIAGTIKNDKIDVTDEYFHKTFFAEKELRDELGALIKKDLNFVEENKNVGFYSTNEAIDIVLKYDGEITKVCNELGVPKAMTQAILFKEIRMKDARDVLADSFVMEYYRYNHEVERFFDLPLWQQILVGAPKLNSPMREDSSTGLGQIFAKTAINAYNAAIQREDIIGQEIDYNDWHQREKVWDALRTDDKENIFYAALVLKNEAVNLNIDLSKASNNQIQNTLARYNGTNTAAAEYGKETLQYYILFDSYNK